MTIPQLLQFYAPLAGLLVMAFMLGALSNRVGTLERERKEDKTTEAALTVAKQNDHDTLIIVASDVTAIKESMAGLHRDMAEVQRQLANSQRPKAFSQEDDRG